MIAKLFWCCRASLSMFSYWSRFHVNIMTGSGVLAIFVYKGLTRSPKIGNSPVWILPNILRLGRVRKTKSGTNVSKKSYWMLQNARVTALTVSELLKEKQQGLPSPTQIRVKEFSDDKNVNIMITRWKEKIKITMQVLFW